MPQKHALFNLPEDLGFTLLEADDVAQQFETGDNRMDRFTLHDYYAWSQEPNVFVIVYKLAGKIVGVLGLELRMDHVFVLMLGRNILNAPGTGVGTKLMRLAESIGFQTGRLEVRLDSLDTSVGFYEKMGYEEYGSPFYEEGWGMLSPRRRRLEPLPSLGQF